MWMIDSAITVTVPTVIVDVTVEVHFTPVVKQVLIYLFWTKPIYCLFDFRKIPFVTKLMFLESATLPAFL